MTRRIAICWLVCLGCMMLAARSEAALVTRDYLLRTCSDKNPTLRGNCVGYIYGVADSGLLPGSPPPTFCVAGTVSAAQLADAVTNYLQSHHGDANEDAAVSVRRALTSAYPCKK